MLNDFIFQVVFFDNDGHVTMVEESQKKKRQSEANLYVVPYGRWAGLNLNAFLAGDSKLHLAGTTWSRRCPSRWWSTWTRTCPPSSWSSTPSTRTSRVWWVCLFEANPVRTTYTGFINLSYFNLLVIQKPLEKREVQIWRLAIQRITV